MMKKKTKVFAKRGSLGYILIGTLVVMVALLCVLVITGSLAPVVLRIHAGNAPAMMTMPLFVYCAFADFILLEVVFLVFQPGAKAFSEAEQAAPGEKKKMPLRNVVGIVCCALLLCSVIIAPFVCNVMTEEGVDTYVFFKTSSTKWEDLPLYELTFSQENGLELYLYFSRESKIPMFGAVNSLNPAFIEKYGSVYDFACYLKEQAVENGQSFKVQSPEAIAAYFKDSAYWPQIEALIQ